MGKYAFLMFAFVIRFFNFNANAQLNQKDDYVNLPKEKYTFSKFSPTTNLKGILYFTIGAIDSEVLNESFNFSYENKLRINSSFDGSDKLLTVIESGNAMNSSLNLDLQSKKGDNLKISTLQYQFKINNQIDAIVGPKMFGYSGLAGKSTVYNERIAILDGSNFTTAAGVGPGVGISAKNKNGINASFKISSSNESFNEESIHLISQLGVTKKKIGGTITSNSNNEFDAIGLAVYFTHKNLPSLSASIEQKEENKFNKTNNWIIALQKNFDNKKIGIAMGTYDSEERIAYEGWSEIDYTDKLKIIPTVFIRKNNVKGNDFGFVLSSKFIY